jgi:hypothetical protein
MAYAFSTPSRPNLQLPNRDRLMQVGDIAPTALLWAIAIVYTTGRLTRIGLDAARPLIGKLLHAMAIAIDGGLLYPDVPEPEPITDSATAPSGSNPRTKSR